MNAVYGGRSSDNRQSAISNQKSFTLLELLVVVAIITVLIAILLPAIAGARESAGRVACGTSLRQMSTAHFGHVHASIPYPPRNGAEPLGNAPWIEPTHGRSPRAHYRSLSSTV